MTKQPNAVSDKGIALIKRFEGLRLNAYQDSVGVWTIGYGHTKTAKRGMVITEVEAEELLRKDLTDARNAVAKYVHVDLTQVQYDALVSWVFNLGVGNLRSSTLLKVLNAGDYDEVPAQIIRWNKARVKGKMTVLKGLTRRRAAEAALFSSDIKLAGDGGEPMVQKPRAGEVEAKPLKKSRTMWGVAAAAIGTTLQGVAEELEALVPVVPQVEPVAIGLTIAGIVAVAYARIDDHLKKAR